MAKMLGHFSKHSEGTVSKLYTRGCDPCRRFSSLTALEDLHFGTVPRVTGKGLLEGLAPLIRLTSLTLVILSFFQNNSIIPAWPQHLPLSIDPRNCRVFISCAPTLIDSVNNFPVNDQTAAGAFARA